MCDYCYLLLFFVLWLLLIEGFLKGDFLLQCFSSCCFCLPKILLLFWSVSLSCGRFLCLSQYLKEGQPWWRRNKQEKASVLTHLEVWSYVKFDGMRIPSLMLLAVTEYSAWSKYMELGFIAKRSNFQVLFRLQVGRGFEQHEGELQDI